MPINCFGGSRIYTYVTKNTYLDSSFLNRSLSLLPALLRKICIMLALLWSTPLFAWIYPEHRQITLLAIQHLDPERRRQLEDLWAEARKGYELRLTPFVIDSVQTTKPQLLDFAAWAAIGGDHSRSPADMLHNILYTAWILRVADIAAKLQLDITAARTSSQHINAVRNADIRLQRIDADYALRASANTAHFLLSRPDANTTLDRYLSSCLSANTQLNALGIYAYFHTGALLKAAHYTDETLSPDQKRAYILAALAEEAFALHFLQDAFAAGHIAGSRGNNALRKGTHDYYNEKGLEVISWKNIRSVNHGDSYMSKDDARPAAQAVTASLVQLLDAAGLPANQIGSGNAAIGPIEPSAVFDVCHAKGMPTSNYNIELLKNVLASTPVPGLAAGPGELPRFRAELGPFWGISAALNASGMSGGFAKEQTEPGAQGGMEANVRFGFGLDGVLNQSGDGLIFIQAGWRQDAASTNKFVNSAPAMATNSFTAAVPGRSAYGLRIRLPFYLFPGDLAVASPFLALFSPKSLTSMATTAANGGIIPWQSGIATPIGRFQFVIGREMGLYFYGLRSPYDALVIAQPDGKVFLVQFKSTKLDFPFLEYRPLHAFSQSQSLNLLVQFSAGVDIPHHISAISPAGVIPPPLRSYGYFGIRLLCNWRGYY